MFAISFHPARPESCPHLSQRMSRRSRGELRSKSSQDPGGAHSEVDWNNRGRMSGLNIGRKVKAEIYFLLGWSVNRVITSLVVFSDKQAHWYRESFTPPTPTHTPTSPAAAAVSIDAQWLVTRPIHLMGKSEDVLGGWIRSEQNIYDSV